MMIKPNPNCNDNFCIKQQEEFKKRVKEEPERTTNEDLSEEKVIHEDNEWGWFYMQYYFNIYIHM